MSLELLGVKMVDQDDLESTITRQANEVLISKDREVDTKRLEKTNSAIAKVQQKITVLDKRLVDPRTKISQRRQIREEIQWFKENEIQPLIDERNEIQARLDEGSQQLQQMDVKTDDRLPDETERDYLIRIGKITAFGNETAFAGEEEEQGEKSHVQLRAPGLSMVDEVEDQEFRDGDGDGLTHSGDEDEAGPVENVDDGDEEVYAKRLKVWETRRRQMRQTNDEDGIPEYRKPHPSIPDLSLNDTFRLPGDIAPSLFDYQKTCVQWLWELYSQKTGGIIGDEMGLGKTIQVISFLAGLHYSGLLEKPVLVIVPATVLNQWVNEFHRWWPPFRCVILHSIGLAMGKKVNEAQLEEYLQQEPESDSKFRGVSNQVNAQAVVDLVFKTGHVLVTTYVGLRIYSKHILSKSWGYCILDEGHKIRNPNLEISLYCKRIKTHNRIILSGTPIQNNLTELWSLFDFVFPGRLGTLPVFEQQFAIPINMGGYANATNLQVQTSYKCATVLRDLISPYLLRRLKHDVARDLPKKLEMVLFVKLTQYQQAMYEKFLESEDLNAIVKGKRNMLMGVDILRKICNHPDLVNGNKDSVDYGSPSKSGKLEVSRNLLKLWAETGHKILLFCQTRQMLDILEKMVSRMKITTNESEEEISDYMGYLRMDGSTPIAKRQYLVDRFNTDPTISLFLLTTKVGGLGVNLTGADRIIIFDPDWNPSTDMQARERAWRLGQKKDIIIYRLMITGLIEEKIYHRQIFKTFLTNKILKDPKQRKFFKMNDLYDLFTLGDQNASETSKMIGQNKTDDDFDNVANIMGVSKMDKFEEENKEDEIIDGIFKNSNVSKLEHKKILDSNKNLGVQKEVDKIVDQSVKLLNELRKITRRNKLGVPTWTGKFGKAGAPAKATNKVGKFNSPSLSSKSILENIKKKAKPEPEAQPQLIDDIIKLFANGKLSSNQVLIKLKDKIDVKNTRDILLVKSLLRKVCKWNGEEKLWQLQDDFKTS